MSKYDRIINLTRPTDKAFRPMSLHNRAAQFAPFDALSGFGGRIYEASRLTENRRYLSEEEKEKIDRKIRQLNYSLSESSIQPNVTVTYFVPDKTKDGGSYQTLTAQVKEIDIYDERLRLESEASLCEYSIAFDDILSIQTSLSR